MSPSEPHVSRARYLRAILAYHGLGQSDLARILKCSQSSASFKLAAKRRLTAEDIVALADTFGIDPAQLLRPPALEQVLGSGAAQLITIMSEVSSRAGHGVGIRRTARRERPTDGLPPELPLSNLQAAA